MQAWQAYHTMTYENKWKATIESQWQAHCAEWEQSHPGEAMTVTQFIFMNNFMKERYNEETEAVKQEVKEFRDNTVKGAGTDINAAFQQ